MSFSFGHTNWKNMKILRKLAGNDSFIARLSLFYTQTIYTIIRIFVMIYGF